MDSLRHATALALALAVPVKAVARNPDPVARWQHEIAVAAAQSGLPERWIAAVMRAESGGHATLGGRPVTSRAGAMGLMQLMPATWAMLRVRLALGHDPYAPADNILVGAVYLQMLHRRFGYPGMFAAYNAGPTRYQAALDGHRPLPAETRAYLAKLAAILPNGAPTVAPNETPSSLFVVTGTPSFTPRTAARSAPLEPARDPLFVVRNDP